MKRLFRTVALCAILAASAAPPARAQTVGNGFLANGLSTTVKNVKSISGQVVAVQCYNPNSSQVYIQIFNTPSYNVTLGTTIPLLSIPIGPTSTGGLAVGPPISSPGGISIAATTTATGSTAPSTAPDCNVIYN